MKHELIIGSRGSKLALWQSQNVQTQLQEIHPTITVRIEIIKTTGDVKLDPLSVIGGQGVFTKELEDALVDGRIDLAVHSLKDLPSILAGPLVIAAICKREDPRDALVLRESTTIKSLLDLPKGSVVGTSSQRRIAQLKSMCPDVVIKDLRGNVDTRLRKLDEGQYDALILATAGLRRLGLQDRISFSIPTVEMLPAVGQGAVAIETHVENDVAIIAVGCLEDEETRVACFAERALLRSLGGGCQAPIAGHAVIEGDLLSLEALVASPDGRQILRGKLSGPLEQPEDLGAALAKQLLAEGAATILTRSGS